MQQQFKLLKITGHVMHQKFYFLKNNWLRDAPTD